MDFSKIFNAICLLGLGLGSAILDFWISPKLQESTEIERKVIEPNMKQHHQSYGNKINFFFVLKRDFLFSEKKNLPKIGCHGNIKVNGH